MENLEARLAEAESRNRLNNRVAGLFGLTLHPTWLTKLLS